MYVVERERQEGEHQEDFSVEVTDLRWVLEYA